MIRASAERDDDNGGCKHTDLFSKTPALRQFGNEPHDGDGDAAERQISIAIGMSLPAPLHIPITGTNMPTNQNQPVNRNGNRFGK